MKRLLAVVVLLACGFATAGFAKDGDIVLAQWKGQVSGKYVHREEPFQIVATDNDAWGRAWRIKLDQDPPRPLADGEIGVVMFAAPRPTPGYTVLYEVTANSAARVTLKAHVQEPEVVMFPAGYSSYPWRALVLPGSPSKRVEVHWE